MINRNTYDGDLEEIEAIKHINANKILYNDNYFLQLNLNIENSFVVRVTSNHFSKLSKKIVKTRADAYAITNCSKHLISFINNNKYVDENILSTYKDEYDTVPKSGLSIKLSDSKKYQILKLTPNSFQTLFSNFELGVVLDRYGRFFIKPNYFNSGMLLMNLKKIKQTHLLEKVRDVCLKKKMSFPDQTALNKFCKLKLYIPRKFNEQGNIKKDTVIQHFSKRFSLIPFFHTINIKPWQINKVQKIYKCHTYDNIFDEYKKIKNK